MKIENLILSAIHIIHHVIMHFTKKKTRRAQHVQASIVTTLPVNKKN